MFSFGKQAWANMMQVVGLGGFFVGLSSWFAYPLFAVDVLLPIRSFLTVPSLPDVTLYAVCALISLCQVCTSEGGRFRILSMISFVTLTVAVLLSNETTIILPLAFFTLSIALYSWLNTESYMPDSAIIGSICVSVFCVIVVFFTPALSFTAQSIRPSLSSSLQTLTDAYSANNSMKMVTGFGVMSYDEVWANTGSSEMLRHVHLLAPIRTAYSTGLTFLVEYGLVFFPAVVFFVLLFLVGTPLYRSTVTIEIVHVWALFFFCVVLTLCSVVGPATILVAVSSCAILAPSTISRESRTLAARFVASIVGIGLLISGLSLAVIGFVRIHARSEYARVDQYRIDDPIYRKEAESLLENAAKVHASIQNKRLLCYAYFLDARDLVQKGNAVTSKEIALRNSRLQKGWEFCDALRESDPNEFRARLLLSLINMQRSQVEDTGRYIQLTIESLKVAQQLAPYYYVPYALEAQIRVARGEIQEAQALLIKVKDIEPRAPELEYVERHLRK
jgi:hypothetical protein